MGKVTQDDLWVDLKTRDADLVRGKYGNVMAALSHGLRGAITASPGKTLYVADYASIEARVVLWLAGDKKALDIFRTGADIYCYMADDIYGYKTNKNDHPKERAIGKIAVLGLGYQMGASKFVETCAAGGVVIPEDDTCEECGATSRRHRRIKDHPFRPEHPDAITAVKVVDAYRAKFSKVKEMWGDIEATALNAIEFEGEAFTSGKTTWEMEGKFLYCTLPSGRKLAYPFPYIGQQKTDWGEVRPQMRFMGVSSYNHQWCRQVAYGGLLVENVTQAVARDVMAEAFMRCEASGIYRPVLTVHDEIVAECDEGKGDVKEFEALVSENPKWARGLPIAAEGWEGFRYHK